MNILLKEESGSSILTTPVIIATGIMLVASLIVLSVNILIPYLWYEKLSSTCIKYVFVMEEFGYLTKTEKNSLLNELIEQGFDKNAIKIDCTSTMQSYGNKIFLDVLYEYKLQIPFLDEKIIPMEIKRVSVSKR